MRQYCLCPWDWQANCSITTLLLSGSNGHRTSLFLNKVQWASIALFTHGKCGAAHINVGRSTFYFVFTQHSVWTGLHRHVSALALKAPLHDTIRQHGAYRLPCTWVNRNVWHVARMSRIPENRVKRIYSSFYFRADSAARAGDYPIRAQQTPKTTFTLYDCERETGGVSQCT